MIKTFRNKALAELWAKGRSAKIDARLQGRIFRRLDALNRYLVDIKGQFDGHDHLGMVDSVLETLMRRQMPTRVRPSESTIRHGQLPG